MFSSCVLRFPFLLLPEGTGYTGYMVTHGRGYEGYIVTQGTGYRGYMHAQLGRFIVNKSYFILGGTIANQGETQTFILTRVVGVAVGDR